MRLETAQLRLGSASCAGMAAPARERELLARVSELPGVRHVALARNMTGSLARATIRSIWRSPMRPR